METYTFWVDAVSKVGVPTVFALIILLKINPSLEKLADAMAVIGERLARIENEAEIEPKQNRRTGDKGYVERVAGA